MDKNSNQKEDLRVLLKKLIGRFLSIARPFIRHIVLKLGISPISSVILYPKDW